MLSASKLKKYCTKKGLTQEQLGQLLGVTMQAVSKWERGGTSAGGTGSEHAGRDDEDQL